MKFKPPICGHCIHLEGYPPQAAWRCEAFPSGIPERIWQATIEHTEPYPGDRGIQFENGTPAWRPAE